MNPPVITAQLREALKRRPMTADALIAELGVKRIKLHKLIHRLGTEVVRIDTTPTAGRHARPVYAWRQRVPPLTNHS